ncbi:MAG: hypothetical protein KDC38_14820 [Planctomycetes bacterium]|nr:hypothetical protein [Planctomycetota bacterium]
MNAALLPCLCFSRWYWVAVAWAATIHAVGYGSVNLAHRWVQLRPLWLVTALIPICAGACAARLIATRTHRLDTVLPGTSAGILGAFLFAFAATLFPEECVDRYPPFGIVGLVLCASATILGSWVGALFGSASYPLPTDRPWADRRR